MAVGVAAAVENLLLRCPTFWIPHGKLEFTGSPSAAAAGVVQRSPAFLPPPPFVPHCALPLLALAPLAGRITHLKLSDLAVGPEEVRQDRNLCEKDVCM